MRLYRKRFIRNGEGGLGFTRNPEPLGKEEIIRLDRANSIDVASPNNWLRRFLYWIGAPRTMTRRV